MSDSRVLEMLCGGKWVEIGRVDNVVDLGSEHAERVSVGTVGHVDRGRSRLLVVGMDRRPELAGVLRHRGYDVVFLDELAETDDKSIDADLEVIRRHGLSGTFEVREEDREKLVEMFEQIQIQSARGSSKSWATMMVRDALHDLAVAESEAKHPSRVDGKPRGKGKLTKDWQR